LDVARALAVAAICATSGGAAVHAQEGDDGPKIEACSGDGGALLAAAPAAASASCNSDVSAPCFADVADILAGRRHLLRNDDLVLNLATLPTSSTMNSENFILETTNLAVSSQITDSVATPSCAIPAPAAPSLVRVGRVFALANDVVVTMAPTNAARGADCSTTSGDNLALTVTDTQDSANNSTTSFAASARNDHLAMADFNLDGYQDLLFINGGLAQAFTAKCTNDPFASCTGTAGNAVSDGLVAGPAATIPAAQTPVADAVVGDFNADGVIDLAWPGAAASGDPITIFFASVCPAADVEVLGQTCSAAFEIIAAPAATAITTGATLAVVSDQYLPAIALSADNFDGIVDQILALRRTEQRQLAQRLVRVCSHCFEQRAHMANHPLGGGAIEPFLVEVDAQSELRPIDGRQVQRVVCLRIRAEPAALPGPALIPQQRIDIVGFEHHGTVKQRAARRQPAPCLNERQRCVRVCAERGPLRAHLL
jgi:hypothetical protein